MTTAPKAPEAPKAPKQAPVAAPTTEVAIADNERKFWAHIEQMKVGIFESDFGSKAGRGGSELKDSHALHHHVRDEFLNRNISLEIVPKDVKFEVVPTGFAVYGIYIAKFYLEGVLIKESETFGSFDTGNSAQATHGSLTAARTSILFNIFQASVKSQEDIEAKRQNELNRQAPRTGATPVSGTPY